METYHSISSVLCQFCLFLEIYWSLLQSIFHWFIEICFPVFLDLFLENCWSVFNRFCVLFDYLWRFCSFDCFLWLKLRRRITRTFNTRWLSPGKIRVRCFFPRLIDCKFALQQQIAFLVCFLHILAVAFNFLHFVSFILSCTQSWFACCLFCERLLISLRFCEIHGLQLPFFATHCLRFNSQSLQHC